ncbi:response regulator [Nibricoccus sp. IMCC34717]|uniref:response regulator n=1 Tax=Nibricoccus sp. IMCC34717 TaxID=3034021 RepID=UPI00384E434C
MANKILTVDDSKTVRIIVNKAFKTYDCQIVEAANGVEGLAVAAKEQPNIILLDITMPVMDGVEMLTKLKADPALKGIPVIMLTAEGGRDQVLKIAKLGIRDYIVKPFKEDLLIEKVGKVLELKSKDSGPVERRTILDSMNLLVVDDKPAIVQQIQEGLKHMPWKITGVSATGEAIDTAGRTPLDLVLVSLSLPEDGGFTLFRLLRQNQKTKLTPVLGLAVKTDVECQQKAQQVGFTQVVGKPIDLVDLETRIVRSLNLDTSPRYFNVRDGGLIFRLPEQMTAFHLAEISQALKGKISEAVNSGIAVAILDLHEMKAMDMQAIKLVMQAMSMCRELSLPVALVGNDRVKADCRSFEDTQAWKFYDDEQAARASLLTPTA